MSFFHLNDKRGIKSLEARSSDLKLRALLLDSKKYLSDIKNQLLSFIKNNFYNKKTIIETTSI